MKILFFTFCLLFSSALLTKTNNNAVASNTAMNPSVNPAPAQGQINPGLNDTQSPNDAWKDQSNGAIINGNSTRPDKVSPSMKRRYNPANGNKINPDGSIMYDDIKDTNPNLNNGSGNNTDTAR